MKTKLAERVYNLQWQIQSNQDTINRIKKATLVKFQNEENIDTTDMIWLTINKENDNLNKLQDVNYNCYLFQQAIIKCLEAEISKFKAEIKSL